VVDRADDDLAALMFTGGTTGHSKGVPLSHENLWLSGWAARQASHVAGLDRGMTALPLSHSYGLLVTVSALHAAEPGFGVLLRWFEPARWLELAARHRVQVSAVVPSMIAALLTQPLEQHDLSDLRNVFTGAAPLPPALAQEFERRVPSAQLLEGYGLTETAAAATASPPGQRRLGTVGRALPTIEIRIADVDGTALPAGADGEILLRGPTVMTGYWRDPEATATTIADGWLHTGDIGHLDADGYLTVVDRKKDLVIRGGHNVYPRDVEDVLLAHPAVRGAAVVGRPDARLGEEVLAFVAVDPAAGVTAEELIQFARERLAATKYPREVRLVDAIPLTAVGKVDRKQLRRLVAGPPADGA
jgi:long-chain acyl-CoA synthetase